MKILIIEDEQITAEDLADNLRMIEPGVEILPVIGSVNQAKKWFKKNAVPDLIFSDIQLGDGLSFEIFDSFPVSAPVIFCTAYDEYALNAFKTNGIAYIVKPFSRKTLKDAIDKYHTLKENLRGDKQEYKAIMDLFKQGSDTRKVNILVYHRDKILPIKADDIALFYINNDMTRLTTFAGQNYVINKTLDELEEEVGVNFFRANRQNLIHRNTIKEAAQYFGRKLSITPVISLGEKIIVSKAKTREFLDWLAGK